MMYNPLLGSFSKLKDADIENKIIELTRKYNIAARSGNSSLCEQICVILETYREEQSRRYLEASKKLAKNKNSDLDDLINVE